MRNMILGALFFATSANAVYVPDCNPPTSFLSATEAAGLGISVVWDNAYGPKAVCQGLVVLAPKQIGGRNGNLYADIDLTAGLNRFAEFSTPAGINDFGKMVISFNVCPPVDGIVAAVNYGAERCDVHEIIFRIEKSPSGWTLSTAAQEDVTSRTPAFGPPTRRVLGNPGAGTK